MAASWVTADALNFMLRWARGLICMPAAPEVLDALELTPMVAPEIAGCDTPFTVPIDHIDGGSGIGAADRALTIRRVRRRRRVPDRVQAPGPRVPAAGAPGRNARAARAHRVGRRPGDPRRAPAGRGDLRGPRRRRARPRASRSSSSSPSVTGSRSCRSTRSPSTASRPAPRPVAPHRCSSKTSDASLDPVSQGQGRIQGLEQREDQAAPGRGGTSP